MIKSFSLQVRTAVIFLTALLVIILVAKSFYFSEKYGGTDLRCRIVGSRLINTDHSPYFYKWNPADGERLLNPNDDPGRKVNGNVVTPAVLYTIHPLANLSYPNIRWIWTLLQLLAAAVSIVLLASRIKKDASAVFTPVCVTLLAIICSDPWLNHIERGQMYVFYAFFMALMYWAYTAKWKYGQFIGGFVGGLFLFFRPTVILFFLGFLIKGKFKMIAGGFTGAVIGALLFVAPNPNQWKDYFGAMNEYSNEMMGKGTRIEAKTYTIPSSIEGSTTITQYHQFNSGGLKTVYSYLDLVGIKTNGLFSLSLLGVVVLVLSFFLYRTKQDSLSVSAADQLFLFGFLLYILSEVFVVAPRAGYNVVQWFFPVCIAWNYIAGNKYLLFIFIVAILLFHNFPFVFPYQQDCGELLLIGIIASLALARILPTGKSQE